MLVAFGSLAHLQAKTYRDAETIWMDTLAKNPDSWMPHTHLAVIRLNQLAAIDQRAEPEKWRGVLAKARNHAQRAVGLKPDDPQVIGTLSEALRIEGLYDDAFDHQSRAIRLLERRRAGQARWPHREATELVKLGRLHLVRGERAQAEAAYRRAAGVDPQSVLARTALASLLAEQGRVDEALKELGTVLSLQPRHFGALLSSAQLSEQRGDLVAARHYYEAAARAARTPLEQIQAAIALARFLATCPDPAQRDIARAVEIAETANRATGRRYPSLLDVLAEAYFAAGNTNQAIATATEARDLAQKLNAPDLAREIDHRLQRYRAGGDDAPN